jgi:hypothetical protein
LSIDVFYAETLPTSEISFPKAKKILHIYIYRERERDSMIPNQHLIIREKINETQFQIPLVWRISGTLRGHVQSSHILFFPSYNYLSPGPIPPISKASNCTRNIDLDFKAINPVRTSEKTDLVTEL